MVALVEATDVTGPILPLLDVVNLQLHLDEVNLQLHSDEASPEFHDSIHAPFFGVHLK